MLMPSTSRAVGQWRLESRSAPVVVGVRAGGARATIRVPARQVESRASSADTECLEGIRIVGQLDNAALLERKATKQREQLSYQVSAIAASVGVTSLAILATYLRFSWHVQDEGIVPWGEMFGTLLLVAGGVLGMEMWARYAHKRLWHDFEPGWALHKSHHEPRVGPFEANDLFAIINGVPAMLLCLFGFLTPGMLGGTCFGAGLGITLFGIMYMFVHDGLVHRRFPVGPIAQLPLMKKLAVAHQLHHSEKYDGVPWGMFLALQELDSIPGARAEVDRLASELDWSKR